MYRDPCVHCVHLIGIAVIFLRSLFWTINFINFATSANFLNFSKNWALVREAALSHQQPPFIAPCKKKGGWWTLSEPS